MPIPKIIHYCWFSDEKYPPLVKRCLRSWEKYLSDYEFRLWDANSFDFDRIPFVKEAFENKKWAFVSDYIRLYALYTYGGVYLDSDVKVHGRFDDWHKLRFFTGIETRPPRFDEYWIEAAVLGSEPGNDMLRTAMNIYENMSFFKLDGTMNLIQAPDLLTPVFIQHYNWERKQGTVDLGNGIIVFGKDKIANDSEYYKKGIILHHRNNCSWIRVPDSRGQLYKLSRYYGILPYYRRIEKAVSVIKKYVNRNELKC